MCVHDGQICFARKMTELRKFSVKYSKDDGCDGIDQSRICVTLYHFVFLRLCDFRLLLRRFVKLPAHQNNPDIGKCFRNHQHADERERTAEKNDRKIESKGQSHREGHKTKYPVI